MPYIRKTHAGSDSFGNVWPTDGAVVEVAPEHAQALLAIADAGFSEVTPPPADEQRDQDEQAVDEAPKPRRSRSPKTAATIEE